MAEAVLIWISEGYFRKGSYCVLYFCRSGGGQGGKGVGGRRREGIGRDGWDDKERKEGGMIGKGLAGIGDRRICLGNVRPKGGGLKDVEK